MALPCALRCPLSRSAGTDYLGGGDSDAVKGGSYVLEQRGQIIPERLRADGDGKGDENNKHRVFGSSGTTFVIAKAFGPERAFDIPSPEDWPAASGRQRSQSPLSRPVN
jgi:hypothetical protein